jgi:hypothetical protein
LGFGGNQQKEEQMGKRDELWVIKNKDFFWQWAPNFSKPKYAVCGARVGRWVAEAVHWALDQSQNLEERFALLLFFFFFLTLLVFLGFEIEFGRRAGEADFQSRPRIRQLLTE